MVKTASESMDDVKFYLKHFNFPLFIICVLHYTKFSKNKALKWEKKVVFDQNITEIVAEQENSGRQAVAST